MDSAGTNIKAFRVLSPRETQLIILAGDGLTDKEIAHELGISRGTVITLWSKVRAKLSINSRISSVAVMSSVLARILATFTPFAKETMSLDSMLGRLSHTRVLLNSRHIILTASDVAANTFHMKSGHHMADATRIGTTFLGPDGHTLLEAEYPWSRACSASSPASSG